MNHISPDLLALLGTEASPAVPRISAAAMLSAPENRPLYDLWTQPPADPRLYRDKRIAVIATDGVEEIELTPLHRDVGQNHLAPRRLMTSLAFADRYNPGQRRIGRVRSAGQPLYT